MNVLGTGLSGLVGSRVMTQTADTFSFTNLSLETGIDITNKNEVIKIFSSSDAPWVFHFAARTDVDGVQSEVSLGTNSPTWIVNVEATRTIIEVCKKTRKHLLYISTDYVFDGNKDSYVEEDVPNPQGWYAKTKYEGEKLVTSLGDYGLIIRIANPYGAFEFSKKDFVHRIIERLAGGQTVISPTDQIFIPTDIDDIALAIQTLVVANASGIYHVVGDTALSPYEAAKQIAVAFDYSETLVHPTTYARYFKGRAPRPFHAKLINGKIRSIGIRMSTFRQGLAKVKASTLTDWG